MKIKKYKEFINESILSKALTKEELIDYFQILSDTIDKEIIPQALFMYVGKDNLLTGYSISCAFNNGSSIEVLEILKNIFRNITDDHNNIECFYSLDTASGYDTYLDIEIVIDNREEMENICKYDKENGKFIWIS